MLWSCEELLVAALNCWSASLRLQLSSSRAAPRPAWSREDSGSVHHIHMTFTALVGVPSVSASFKFFEVAEAHAVLMEAFSSPGSLDQRFGWNSNNLVRWWAKKKLSADRSMKCCDTWLWPEPESLPSSSRLLHRVQSSSPADQPSERFIVSGTRAGAPSSSPGSCWCLLKVLKWTFLHSPLLSVHLFLHCSLPVNFPLPPLWEQSTFLAVTFCAFTLLQDADHHHLKSCEVSSLPRGLL